MSAPFFIDTAVREVARLAGVVALVGGEHINLKHLQDLFAAELYDLCQERGLSWRVIGDLLERSTSAAFEHARRVRDSRGFRGMFTVWGAVLDWLRSNGPADRAAIDRAFNAEDADVIGAVLRGLVAREVVAETGRGRKRRYLVVPGQAAPSGADMDDYTVQVALFGGGPSTRDALASRLGISEAALPLKRMDAALARLREAKRVVIFERDEPPRLYCPTVVIPGDAASGRYAAMIHHLATVTRLLGRFIEQPEHLPVPAGSTYQFDLAPGNAYTDEVRGLRAELSARLTELRERVDTENARIGAAPEDTSRVAVYLGQIEDPPGTSGR